MSDTDVRLLPSARFSRAEIQAMPYFDFSKDKNDFACQPLMRGSDKYGKIVIISVNMASGSVHFFRPIVLTNRRDQERMMRGE